MDDLKDWEYLIFAIAAATGIGGGAGGGMGGMLAYMFGFDYHLPAGIGMAIGTVVMVGIVIYKFCTREAPIMSINPTFIK